MPIGKDIKLEKVWLRMVVSSKKCIRTDGPGGFEVSMKWEDAQLTTVTVLSKLGGRLRLRSYTPLEGDELVKAVGINDNPLYAPAVIQTPLISSGIIPQHPVLYQVFEYDIITEPGKTYTFGRARPNSQNHNVN
jgi:alpha-L-fucosidase 2